MISIIHPGGDPGDVDYYIIYDDISKFWDIAGPVDVEMAADLVRRGLLHPVE